ncbi:hypothetical protein D7319_31125 [Streptomyces radicis]|uniref:Uncharacterized protein n=1 Tax=Streptomyces radicis TaxID=1750517 RepID=A0A3A9WCB8_9ACTN|nr:hypothetical protein D7319_31125 [Streptomyces radicis]RKN13511.1 hypothetical protein D7318_31120 [Streptomyces radicis]
MIRRVEVTPATILTGDVLTIGERDFIVMSMDHVHGGVKLRFASGELFAMSRRTTVTVLRADPPGLRTRSFWEGTRHRRPPTRAEIVAQTAVGCALVIVLMLAVVIR